MSGVIPLSVPIVGEREAELLHECIASGFVSSAGPFVGQFESALGAVVGAEHIAAVSAGTAALQLAAIALGVGPDSEVWVPDLTFVATANAMAHTGATLALVDAGDTDFHIDPDLVVDELARRRATGRPLPTAIVATHLYGHLADLAWVDVARSAGVVVIEDAAESLGAEWLDGRRPGTVADAGCFSFNGNKIVTCGGGGAVVGPPDVVERVAHLATQAKVSGFDDVHDEVGFNHRMVNLCAAVGVAQLDHLDAFVGARRAIAARYADAFAEHDAISVQASRAAQRPSGWLSVISLRDELQRDRVLASLRAADIAARRVWLPMHHQAPFSRCERIGDGTRADHHSATGVCLPSSASLTIDEQSRVIRAVLAAVEGSSA